MPVFGGLAVVVLVWEVLVLLPVMGCGSEMDDIVSDVSIQSWHQARPCEMDDLWLLVCCCIQVV